VRARHPGAEAGPPVLLVEPRRDLVLDPAPRHRASLRVLPAPEPVRDGQTEPSVVLGGPGGLARAGAALAGDRLSFAGFEPGRYDLWVDVAGFAPRLLHGVRLGEGTSDLGTVELGRGSALQIRVLGRDREALPALTIAAQAEAAPRYQRSLRTDGGERALLAGLGEGTFRVTAWDRLTGQALWSARLAADGVHDLEVEIDLR
jgi:hypothetical protein